MQVLHTIPGHPNLKRRSPRVYTHAVVADFDLALAVENATLSCEDAAVATWDYESEKANGVAGTVRYRRGDGTVVLWEQPVIDKARAFIAANPDRADYIAAQIRDAVERASERPDGELVVLQWSMSERNALKGANSYAAKAGSHSVRNVRVTTVERHLATPPL